MVGQGDAATEGSAGRDDTAGPVLLHHVQPGSGQGCHDTGRHVHHVDAHVCSRHHTVPETNGTLGVLSAHHSLT